MQQDTLWNDTILDACGSAAQAAGGTKRVAGKLWPTLDHVSATARLRCCLNPDHAQKLDPEELLALIRIGKDAGNHCIVELIAREAGYEFKALASAESKKRAKRVRRLALLDELKRLEDEE